MQPLQKVTNLPVLGQSSRSRARSSLYSLAVSMVPFLA
jgi:hypothetical protein